MTYCSLNKFNSDVELCWHFSSSFFLQNQMSTYFLLFTKSNKPHCVQYILPRLVSPSLTFFFLHVKAHCVQQRSAVLSLIATWRVNKNNWTSNRDRTPPSQNQNTYPAAWGRTSLDQLEYARILKTDEGAGDHRPPGAGSSKWGSVLACGPLTSRRVHVGSVPWAPVFSEWATTSNGGRGGREDGRCTSHTPFEFWLVLHRLHDPGGPRSPLAGLPPVACTRGRGERAGPPRHRFLTRTDTDRRAGMSARLAPAWRRGSWDCPVRHGTMPQLAV